MNNEYFLKVMKTNNMNINSIMKTYSKYICLFLMLVGMSVNVWGAKTGTINFGNNGVKINTSTVNGADNQSNTWKIVTTFPSASTSFSQNADYSQVGSSGTPASTITFGVKLSHVVSITAFSAKFGGFSSTAGTVTLKVTNKSTSTTSSVGSGSLSGTSDVTVSNSTTATGDSLTVTVTSIAKGVKCYYISYTYSNADKFTVTYNAEGGTCETSSEKESTIEGGVELPEATLSASAAAMGWGFYGWAASAVGAPTETAPTIVGKAGDTYYPEGNITLHAVYAKGEYTKETSEITANGKYLIVATNGGHNYVMTNQLSTYEADSKEYGQLAGKLIDETSTNKYSASSIHADYVFTIVTSASVSVSTGNWMIKNVSDNKYVSADYQDLYITNISSADGNTITLTSGTWTIENVYSSTSKIQYNTSENQFRAKTSTATSLLIYKETTTPKYCSNPSTVKLVASPAAGGTVVFDDNSSAEMDFATEDGYIGDITATPNDGYDFLNWVSSDEDVAIVDAAADPTTELTATESATITAHFYQKRSISYILTEGGVAGEVGNPTTVTKDEKDGFVVGFNLQAHYKDMTLVSVTMGGSPLTEGAEADYEWEEDSGTAMLTIHHDNINGDIVITVLATHMEYTKYAFSCAELTLTAKPATEGTPFFITSRTEQTVRSQDSILVVGNGLTPSATLEFPGLPSKFEIKTRTGSALSTDENGEIDAVAYIYYTPGAGDTSDGLDKLTGITVSVKGAKPKTVVLTQDIIGRHLPTDFVIAAKYNGKWYALPDTMTGLRNPEPIEIAVDDADNPTIAYTANTNFYKLYGQSASTDGSSTPGKLYSNGEMIKLGMTNNGTYANYPLFGSPTGTSTLGKGGTATTITNNIGAQYWWKLAQKNPSITNPQDAKYIVYAANNTSSLRIKNKPNQWGFYASGVDTIRLIPAIAKNVVEAYFIEYGQHGGIIEVDKLGMNAWYVKAKLNGDESPLTVFYETQTSVLYGSTKYNYTVNFGDAIDFADADAVGKILTLEWYDVYEDMVGVTTIELPKIIASDATMTTISSSKRFWENMEVHVLPGSTLTANAYSFSGNNVTIKQLEIYPGAKVNVSTGTLNVTDLMLRNGWTRAGSKNYGAGKMVINGSANLTHTNAYLDLYIDNDQYYPLAVPFPVSVGDISYVYSNRSFTVGGPTGEVRLRYYDGASRAEGKMGNWKFYGAIGCLEVPETLVPSMGYAIAVKRPAGKAFSVLRLPLTFADAWTTGGEHGSATVAATPLRKDTVHVYAYGNAKTAENNKGWNLIGNPYMTVYNGDDEDGIYGKLLAVTNKEDAKADKVRYVTIPNSSFTDYTQVNYVEANIQPYSSFLIQAKDTCRIEFFDSKIIPSAPARYTATPAQMYEQEAYIRLSNENSSDQMGLIIGEDYTAAYETNADLAKMHGELNTLKTYMVYDSVDMAYLAINEELAKEWIPVVARIPESGEYTYSLRTTSVVNELEGIYLIDYQTNTVTNLIENNYSFTSEAGIIEGRFSINVIAGQRETPTDIDAINAGGDLNSNKPVKFVWNDKVYIWLNGVIYDTTGKRVK